MLAEARFLSNLSDRNYFMKAQSLILFTLIAVIYGCSTNPATGRQDMVFMSEADEIAIGKQSHEQIMRQYSLYNDLELQNYVQYVGKKVAANSHRNHLDFQFYVLDSPEVNAFATPGGYIYITRGLMAYLNTEGDLAAVLGHEIGHVTARHAARQHSASQITGLGAAIGTMIGEAFIPGISAVGGQELIGVLGTAYLRGYGRDHELEADRLGAEYLARSGYDPDAILDVIGILKNQELYEIKLAREEGRQPRIYHGVFSTHPDSDTRLREVVGYAYGIKEASTESTFIGRTEYLQRIDGLIYGESAEQGLIRGRDYYHGDMGFAMRFPLGWQLQNLPDRLIGFSANGAASIQLLVRPADPRIAPKDFVEKNMGLQSISNGQAMTINGLPAYTGTAVINTDVGRRLSRITVIYHQNMAFIMAGRTQDANGLSRYDSAFLDTSRTFRPLTNEERLIASQSNRIRLLRADETTTFTTLAASSTLEKNQELQLRLVNGLYPSGEIEPGQLVKTIEY